MIKCKLKNEWFTQWHRGPLSGYTHGDPRWTNHGLRMSPYGDVADHCRSTDGHQIRPPSPGHPS